MVFPTPGGPLLGASVLILGDILHKDIQPQTFSLDEVVKRVGLFTARVLSGQCLNELLRLGWDFELIEHGLIPADV